MVYSLTYRRPSHVPASRDSLSDDEKQKSIDESIDSGSTCMIQGIPDALSFDRIISGGVCPPCTVRDFMNYLKYIEHSAENLQFYLWYQDFVARFDQLPASEKALSPEWTQANVEVEAAATTPARTKRVDPQVAAVLKDTDFADEKQNLTVDRVNPFNNSSDTSVDEKRDGMTDYSSSMGDDKTLASSYMHQSVAEQAFEDAGMKWKPFTTQPYREEINRVISIYISEGSPRELNLSGRERRAVLQALQITTHPSAFHSVITTVEYSLRKQAHPNFIRWTICNGNKPRQWFARGLGVFLIIGALVADLLITLSTAGRGYRVIPLIFWLIGIATLIAGWKGMCVVLHGMHHRHLRPWELFSDDADTTGLDDEKSMSQTSFATSDFVNSYEDQPWVARYKKRNILRKILDREIWIQEPALRQIQDTIFIQSILAGLVIGGIMVGIFCAVPRGNFF